MYRNDHRCVLSKLTNAKNQAYGILIINDKVYKKEDITREMIKEQLEMQMDMLDAIFKPFTEKEVNTYIRPILTISDHEYLHQGQMILMFREAGVELPKRFSTAWALD